MATSRPNQRTIAAARGERTGSVGGGGTSDGGRFLEVRVCLVGVAAAIVVAVTVVVAVVCVCAGGWEVLASRMGQLLFKKCFWDAIRRGGKRTLRRWSSPRVNAGERAFAPGVGWLRVGSVEAVDLTSLGDSDARERRRTG